MKDQGSVDGVPQYLMPYIVKQDPSLYTPMDHASWRFILKISQSFFAKRAHQKYLDGLVETGISIERIPLVQEMSDRLKKFNWRAVPVSGFIPPAVFMEFLSLGILPIACDMRSIDHLAYTPAPDIVHEAAGHAPIIADPEYASYLRSYGEISRKSIISSQDMNVYYAIRILSDTKEDPASTPEQIEAAQKKLDDALGAVTFVSEATLLSRMAWWTFEYGMVGSLEDPKIYGAGLLSSMGESYHCFDPTVKRLPFSLDCIEMSYDITRPQPQLYVAPDFHQLKNALEDLAGRMAFRRGGVEGLEKAKMANSPTTVVLDSGIQVSGVLTDYFVQGEQRPYYVKWSGPTQLSFGDQQLEGQGADYHREGYSSPIEDISEDDLKKAGFELGGMGKLVFPSGVVLEGKWIDVLRKNNRIVLLTFDQCTVSRDVGGRVEFLFRPEWGKFDIVCGRKVVSVFGGAADRARYLKDTGGFNQEPGRQKSNLTEKNKELNTLYAELRRLRENEFRGKTPGGTHEENSKKGSDFSVSLTHIYASLNTKYPKDWLLRFEILELLHTRQIEVPWRKDLLNQLKQLAKESTEKAEMIQRGLGLIES